MVCKRKSGKTRGKGKLGKRQKVLNGFLHVKNLSRVLFASTKIFALQLRNGLFQYKLDQSMNIAFLVVTAWKLMNVSLCVFFSFFRHTWLIFHGQDWFWTITACRLVVLKLYDWVLKIEDMVKKNLTGLQPDGTIYNEPFQFKRLHELHGLPIENDKNTPFSTIP